MPYTEIQIPKGLDPSQARLGLKGIEREALRVTRDGHIAQTPHPVALGSTLTHPRITTDFSEALLEFVTQPHQDHQSLLRELGELEAFTSHNLGDELLWMSSMPCFIDSEEKIPIAWYGTSNAGQMKHVYRKGLAKRYGRAMQTIAGVHFNYSFPDAFWTSLREALPSKPGQEFSNRIWMGVVRNVQRFGWLLLYLFGSSPAACPSFARRPPVWLKPIDNGSLTVPYGTSLRMSDLGYKNSGQAYLSVSTNSLDEYVHDLSRALLTEDPAYATLGVHEGDNWTQLSSGILQIENEFYSLVRPKATPSSGERPSATLLREGIRYIEIRALDIDPMTPFGISPEALHFMELFVWYCALYPSPLIHHSEKLEIDYNQRNTAVHGRRPGLGLRRNGTTITLEQWGKEVIENLEILATYFDCGLEGKPYSNAAALAKSRLENPQLTPSAAVLKAVTDDAEGYLHYTLSKSICLNQCLLEMPLANEAKNRMEKEAKQSLEAQGRLENGEGMTFESFVAAYYSSGPTS